jgi:glutamine synthetase
MSGSAARLQAIEAVTRYAPLGEPLNFAESCAGEHFGTNVFGLTAMRSRLPKSVYRSLVETSPTSWRTR